MNINRNNYEEYFLLYIDNELDATGKAAVERFVAENADLQMELDILKETVFPAEDIVFANKSSLVKEEIPLAMQEQLLMHLDGELNRVDASSLNKKLVSDRVLQAEWDVLQKTKLDASEKMIFPFKSVLYRKSEGRVIGFNYRRLAAAAVMIGILLSAGYFYFTSNDGISTDAPTVNVASTKKPVINKEATKVPVTDPAISNPDQETASADNAVPNQKNLQPQIIHQKNIGTPDVAVISNTQNKNQPSIQNNIVLNQKNRVVPSNNNNQLAVQQQKNNEVVNTPAIITPEIANPTLASNNKSDKKEMVPLTDVDVTKRDNTDAMMASLNDTESDKLMYVDEEKITRSKFGGFIKKVKRVVERNAKLKTSGGLRLGGFDIALK